MIDFEKDGWVAASVSLQTLRFDWLDNVNTRNEKWVLYDNDERTSDVGEKLLDEPEPRTPQESYSPRVYTPRKQCLRFGGVSRVGYWELLPEGCTITAQEYVTKLRKLKVQLESKHVNQAELYIIMIMFGPHRKIGQCCELAGCGLSLLSRPCLIRFPPYSRPPITISKDGTSMTERRGTGFNIYGIYSIYNIRLPSLYNTMGSTHTQDYCCERRTLSRLLV